MIDFFRKIFTVILFFLSVVVMIPLLFVLSVGEKIVELMSRLIVKCLSKKNYNERKVRKRLIKRIKRELKKVGFFYLSDKYTLTDEEYCLYVNLKYLFTDNKRDFVYKLGTDMYLYNYYDFNANKDGFIDKWIKEIKDSKEFDIDIVPKEKHTLYRVSLLSR